MIVVFAFMGALLAWLLVPGEKYRGNYLRLKTLTKEASNSPSLRSPQSVVGTGRGAKQGEAVADEAQILSGLIAQVRNGGEVREYVERLAGRKFASQKLGIHIFEEAFAQAMNLNSTSHAKGVQSLMRARESSELNVRVHRLSVQVLACVRLSEVLGCPLAQSLMVVLRLFRRSKHTDDLRSQAFSMPKATVKLLSALPLVTLLGGEVLGARPLNYLLSGVGGWLCLVLGLGFYGFGMYWIRSLLRDFMEERDTGQRTQWKKIDKKDGKRHRSSHRNKSAQKSATRWQAL